MKKFLFMALLGLSLPVPKAHAQWVVNDPASFAGNIASTVKGIAITSKTIRNTLDGFREVEELCNDTKKYYDTLRKMNSLIGDTHKAKECILMVGDISEVYATSYKKMFFDKNFRPPEFAAIASDYTKLLEQSGESLKELKSTVESGAFSMNDHRRMQATNRIYTTLRKYRSLVSYYTRKSISTSHVRMREKSDPVSMRALYGNIASYYW